MKLCECGCGKKVTKDENRFIFGHQNHGKHLSEEHKKKLSKLKKGEKNYWFEKHLSEEHKKKLSESKKGKPGSNLGKHFSEEHKRKISKSMKGKKHPVISGKNNGNWKGGISKELYGESWTENLKEVIRQRDHHVCRVCGKRWEGGKKLSIHHIDYDKKHCDLNNLITLCRSCHTKTNFNREKWIEWFTYLLNPFK